MISKEKLESMLDNLTTLYNETYLPLIHQYGPIDLGKIYSNIAVTTYNPNYTNMRILGDLLNRKPQIGKEGCFCTAKGIDWLMSAESDTNNDFTDTLNEHAIAQIVKICDGIKDSKVLDSIDKIKTIKENLIVHEVSFTFFYNGVKVSITGK